MGPDSEAAPSSALLTSRSRSWAYARDRVLVTVPSGLPSSRAISSQLSARSCRNARSCCTSGASSAIASARGRSGDSSRGNSAASANPARTFWPARLRRIHSWQTYPAIDKSQLPKERSSSSRPSPCQARTNVSCARSSAEDRSRVQPYWRATTARE